MTKEQSDEILEKLSDIPFLKRFRNPVYSETPSALTVHYPLLDFVDCKMLLEFAQSNGLNFSILPLGDDLSVYFWVYLH